MSPSSECPACLDAADHEQVSVWNGYTFHKCRACGVVFCLPRKNPGRDWYEGSLIHQALSNFLSTQVIWYHKQFINDPAVYGKTLLDVGCGTGNFLNQVRGKYEVWGVDFNRASIEIARKRFGLDKVSANDLDGFTAENPGLKFDVLTSFEVLEHQDSPAEFIGKMKRLLKPGGHIAVSVPNRNSRVNSLKEADRPPNHLLWWDTDSFRIFLEKSGFEVLRLYPRMLDSEGLADNFENMLRFSGAGRLIFRTSLDTGSTAMMQKLVYLTDLAIRTLFRPANIYLSRSGHQGSNLYALARLK